MSFDLKSYLAEKKEIIDTELNRFVDGLNSDYTRLKESILYSLNAGGKRLRPILCLASCETVGGNISQAVPAACALEMIHTYSLIHDDLPCMDDDSLRRGKPTNHKVFGEATAILAGDALLTDAFYLITTGSIDSGLSSDVVIDIIRDISACAGSGGMIGGQAIDLSLQGAKQIPVDMVKQMHLLKTGALIRSSVAVGARIGGGGQNQIEALERFGTCLGLAYQIRDDLLDIEGGADLGKDARSDIEKNKVTYPSVAGSDSAREKVDQLTNNALKELDIFGESATPLKEITKYLCERKS